jgi:hypothetical protein
MTGVDTGGFILASTAFFSICVCTTYILCFVLAGVGGTSSVLLYLQFVFFLFLKIWALLWCFGSDEIGKFFVASATIGSVFHHLYYIYR